MDVERWHRYHILHLVRIVGQSKDVGREGAIDSVCYSENARIRSDDVEFTWRKRILPLPWDMEELHKVDLRKKNDEDWLEVHKDYIDRCDRLIKHDGLLGVHGIV